MRADPLTPGDNPAALVALTDRLAQARGTVIGVSSPVQVSQPEEDAFAALIGDWDPMHNDPAWTMADGGGPIVLGFHMLPRIENSLRRCPVISDSPAALQVTTVGLNKVRFPAPFPVGSSARAEISVLDVAVDGAGIFLTTRHRYALADATRPVMVAEHLALIDVRREGGGGHWSSDVPACVIDDVPVTMADIPGGLPVARSAIHDSAFFGELAGRSGDWLGATPWTCISDREAHAFALLTGSDSEDLAGDLPSRAHPFAGRSIPPLQLLALRAYFSPQVGLPVLTDRSMMAFNYGVDRARWYAPVSAGTRLRDHVMLRGVETRRPGDHLVITRHVLEAEASDFGVLVADCKTLYRTKA